MPLLHRKPFAPEEYPMDLKENDDVFVCHLTREIFKDYDDFCERIILCNSLVWSCSLTGRSHLTYQEAAASEEKVKKLLKRFPMELREPVLYLSSICERRSLVELAEEVYSYVKDRYFIGETVEVEFPDGEVSCEVLSVVPPTAQELDSLKGHKDKDDRHSPPALSYKYVVERMDNRREAVVEAIKVARKKSAYTKDKNRLYIKQFVRNDQGIWRLKESTNTKYGISKIQFNQLFCGDPPDMNPKKPVKQRKSTPDKPKKQETLNKYFKASAKKMGLSPRKSPRKGDVSASDLKKARRRRRSKKEMEADKMKEEALKKMQLKRKAVSKAEYNQFVREWYKKRDDLECEDLKEMPTPHPVECNIPNEKFGDVVMFMEFFSSFKKMLDTKDFFPHGLTFELMERCLTVKEVAGPLSDLLQLLLCRIFGLLDGELDEIKQTDLKVNPSLVLERGDQRTRELTKLAAKTDYWIRRHHGVPITQLQVDTSTVSEMLRLHLVTSGSMSDKNREARWRYLARGGYCNSDDPGVQLRRDHPDIIEKLGAQSVFELDINDRIEILKCLMNQFLTYSSTRDFIEEGCEKAKQCKVELRALRAEQTRKEKEEAIRLKDLKKAGLPASKAADKTKDEEEEVRERELRSGVISENKSNIQMMLGELRTALRSAQMAPLGTDRAHRRYWLIESIPGLFVEDRVEFKGPCLPKPTPSASFCSEDSLAYIQMLFKESSNKENISDTQENHVSSSPKKLLAEKNGESTPVPRARTKSEMAMLKPLTCWADPENCPVHGSNINRPTWSYIKNENELERLIQSLNKRGHKEKKLRETLTELKDKISQLLGQFPEYLFSSEEEEQEITDSLRLRNRKINKAYENANLGFPEGTALEEIIESSLRDLILETEEKISAGALGYLKVKDREAWRAAIANNGYDRQCKQFTWGTKVWDNEDVDEEMEVDDEEETDSRCSSPSLVTKSSSTRKFPKGFDPVPQRQVVLDLASAIVQVEQGIEPQFLKKPLGLFQKPTKVDKGTINPTMERWEQAVMESTNYAQLFLHLSTLDNSVAWTKSALNVICRICRRKTDPESMLLCDTCNKGHHMYCLKPKLTKVPSGDWFCLACKPKESISPSKKKRRMFSEDSDNEETEDTETFCDMCNGEGPQLICDTCDIKLHLACVNPPVRKAPKSKWFCHDCRAQNAAPVVKKETDVKSESSSPSSKSDLEPTKKIKKESLPTEKKIKTREEKPKSKEAEQKLASKRTERRSLFNDGENGEVDENEFKDESRSRRSRRSLETVRVQKQRDLPLDNASLQEILETLMHHKDAWPFLRPVTKSEVPDYHLIVRKPMDFATIKHKLNMLEYSKNSELIADVELLFDNCRLYNQEGSEVFEAGETLETLFYDLCRQHSLQVNGVESPQEPPSKKARTVL